MNEQEHSLSIKICMHHDWCRFHISSQIETWIYSCNANTHAPLPSSNSSSLHPIRHFYRPIHMLYSSLWPSIFLLSDLFSPVICLTQLLSPIYSLCSFIRLLVMRARWCHAYTFLFNILGDVPVSHDLYIYICLLVAPLCAPRLLIAHHCTQLHKPEETVILPSRFLLWLDVYSSMCAPIHNTSVFS